MSETVTRKDVDGCAAPSAPGVRFPKLATLIDYLDSLEDRADLATLTALLRDLNVTRADILGCCKFGGDRYQRNIISESPWYELVALCWHSGQRTPIHDHQGSSCAFKVIEGSCTEVQFAKTPSGLICPTSTNTREPGYICASHDADIHQVLNAQPPGEDMITLHIYSPALKNYRKYTLDSPCPKEQVAAATFHAQGV